MGGVIQSQQQSGQNRVVQFCVCVCKREKESTLVWVFVSAGSTWRLWQIVLLRRGRWKKVKRGESSALFFIFHSIMWSSVNHLPFDPESQTIRLQTQKTPALKEDWTSEQLSSCFQISLKYFWLVHYHYIPGKQEHYEIICHSGGSKAAGSSFMHIKTNLQDFQQFLTWEQATRWCFLATFTSIKGFFLWLDCNRWFLMTYIYTWY